jgi:uncharacterized membrane protein
MNKQRKPNKINLIWLTLIAGMLQGFSVNAGEPIVHALLFYSPTCPHCHKVISDDLPPLFEKYGKQLRILLVNTQEQSGDALYDAAIKQFHIPEDRLGVPTLIVGNEVLVGSDEIPARFPGLIETFLAQGGVDWPSLPGLEPANVNTPAAGEMGSLSEKLARDPIGNGLAIIVLIGMIIVVLLTFVRFKQNIKNPQSLGQAWVVLCLLGLAVAGYMVYIDMAQVAAVCGPVGDCNTVQQSEYAHLFGVIPVSVLGVIGYLAILLAWGIGHYGSGKLAYQGRLALFFLALSGTLFSIYLTFLEPFVIGATCAWCLASAIIMTVLLWRTWAVKTP